MTARAQVSPGLWTLAWRRLRADRLAMFALAVVVAFLLLMLASSTGLVARDWSREVGVNYAPPGFVGADAALPTLTTLSADTAESGTEEASGKPGDNPLDPLAADIAELKGHAAGTQGAGGEVVNPVNTVDPLAEEVAEIKSGGPGGGGGIQDPLADDIRGIESAGAGAGDGAAAQRSATLPFGADKWGRDVLQKTIKGSESSILVGLAAALVATLLGTVFGALAGYFGKWVDDFFNWFYSIFTSIPYLLLILSIAAVVPKGKGLLGIVLILGLTGWTGVFRLVRAEYMKHKSREYVLAADAIGASDMRKMFIHIFPNVSHVALVQLSILVVGFIKSEVILSFLGFGVPVDSVSWGSMLNEAQNELILGKWWQLAAASAAMAVLVTAFSLFTDALRDALDPKLK